MHKEIHIRQYRAEDELQWLDVHASVMVDSSAWWIVLHEKPAYKNDIVDMVAVEGDKLVGFLTLEIDSEIMKDDSSFAFAWEFGVHREFRGRGIGRKLIDMAHKELKEEHGIQRSIWFSQDEKAQKFYEHMGMQEIERHWQFSFYPTEEQKKALKQDGIDCWDIRGSCSEENFSRVKEKYKLIEDNPALKPRLCKGYELIFD